MDSWKDILSAGKTLDISVGDMRKALVAEGLYELVVISSSVIDNEQNRAWIPTLKADKQKFVKRKPHSKHNGRRGPWVWNINKLSELVNKFKQNQSGLTQQIKTVGKTAVFNANKPTIYVGLNCAILNITDKAILVSCHNKSHWLPLSKIKHNLDLTNTPIGTQIIIDLPLWLASKENLPICYSPITEDGKNANVAAKEIGENVPEDLISETILS